MPLVGPALSSDQLAALELWINAGAPQSGRVGEFNEVEQLLGLCGSEQPPIPAPPGYY